MLLLIIAELTMDIGTDTAGSSTDQQMNSLSDMNMADDTNDDQRLSFIFAYTINETKIKKVTLMNETF